MILGDVKELKIDKSQWTPVKFGDVAFEPKETVKDPRAEGIEHVVGLEHIDSENIHLVRSETLDQSTTFTKKFAVNDVLFGRRRAYLKKAAQASFDGICSGDITVLRAKDNLLPTLLPFVVQNEKFFDYAIKHSAGGLSPRVKFKDLANYEFLLPPKDQQLALAELLWAMDGAIEKERTLVEKFYLLLETRINDLCLGRKHVNLVNTIIGKLPRFWELKSIEDISSLVTKGTTPTSLGGGFSKVGINFVKVESVDRKGGFLENKFEHINFDVHEKLKRSQLSPNDILFSIAGALGRTAIVPPQICPANTNQAFAIIRLKEGVLPKFIYYYLKTNQIINFIDRIKVKAAQPNLSLKNVRDFNVPIPPYEEQVEIVNYIDEVFVLNRKLEEKIIISKTLNKSLINQVF